MSDTRPQNGGQGAVRDRIRELRRVRAGDLLPNPENWRRHPTEQIRAVEAILQEVGYADALIGRETDAGVMLIDGHLRADLDPDQEVPVLILDVDEDEARKILATLDPLSALATIDADAMRSLASLIEFDSAELDALIQIPDVPLPDPEPMEAPEIDADHVVEIRCSASVLQEIRPQLEEWSSRDGCAIDIS